MKKHRVLEYCITEGTHVVWEGQGRLISERYIWVSQVKLGSKEMKSIPGRGNSMCKDPDVGKKWESIWCLRVLTLSQELLFSQWLYDIGIMI